MRSVLVSHPHAAAFATWTAQSLARAGRLARYSTGAVAVRGTLRGRGFEALAQARPRLLNRTLAGLERGQVDSHSLVEAAARAVGRLGAHGPSTYDALFTAHDARVAWSRWPSNLDAVYAYEDGAERTFERARKKGLRCVWDLPIPHFETLRAIIEDEMRRWPGAAQRPLAEPEWKQRRKEHERSLADLICVASPFTRESLERAGARQPIVVAPYPFPVEAFPVRTARPSGPITFVSVGTHDLRKGTPYLLEAWRRAELRDARLVLIGPLRLSDAFLTPYRGTFEHLPHVAKAMLGDHYRGADALLFPTLGDGFGLVIPEAMASGTPVVTTRCGGGPACITSGEDGWLVPERDVDALVERLRAIHADREQAFQVGQRARARAERGASIAAGEVLIRGLDAHG